ncbi:Sulfite reduction-associated complex DsrMKJOP protein DsrP (= HmeB) [hydrothermal vent metagenome]|uniref:Sulfite reduction-associated complex DsrMKJOP protein DsrP (= HmeB) n=1 Tax=hydrothermal vent metagenome TaxID=652676 RepID=A0A1W1BLX2_9ZZZZ
MNIRYLQIDGDSKGFYTLVGILVSFVLLALGSVFVMEHNGHWISGMSNNIVWGMPHVFAIFLIVAASGALNIASISSVFNKKLYKPLARFSGLVSLALLAGGLMVLVLDLGRPDRLIVAMTKYNFSSIFAWNIILYNGFFAIVGIYLWFQFENKMQKYIPIAGMGAFLWRLILTTGTGSIFGFLVARQAYDAVIFAPMFIIMSFSFGLAIFLILLVGSYKFTERELGDVVVNRLRNLLGVFIGAVLYFVIIYHLGNLYLSENTGVESFYLVSGGIYTQLFWLGQILLGSLVPLALLYCPRIKGYRTSTILASVFVILGGLIQLYLIIIGGQAYPLEIFQGKEIISEYRGIVTYIPSIYEILLGLGGVAVAVLIVVFLIKILPFLPESLANKVADPHFKE